MSAPELKPCPFCGGEAKSSSGNSTYGRLWWAVWCDHCQVEMRDQEVWDKSRPGYLDPAYPPGECLARWNTRATDTRLADAEEMAEAAERFRLFLSDHPSPAVTYLVTSVGNDAWADFCAALAKWRAGK